MKEGFKSSFIGSFISSLTREARNCTGPHSTFYVCNFKLKHDYHMKQNSKNYGKWLENVPFLYHDWYKM